MSKIHVPEMIRKATQIILPDEQFNLHLDQHVQLIDKIIEDKQKTIIPTLIFHFFNDPVIKIAPIIIGGDAEDFANNKYTSIEKIGYQMGKQDKMVKVVFFLSEAWVRAFKDMEEFEKAGKPIRHMEDKKEVLVLTGLTIDMRANGFMVIVDRGKDGEFIEKERVTQHYGVEGKDTMESDLLLAFYQGLQKGIKVFKKLMEPDPVLEEGIMEIDPDSIKPKKMEGVN